MNREPSSELVSAVAPVKTESESSAATPATPNTMPGAALHSVVFSLEYPRKKVKGKKNKSYLPLFTSLLSSPFLCPLFPCLFVSVTVCVLFSPRFPSARSRIYIYIRPQSCQRQRGNQDDRSALGKDLFHGRF